MTGGVVRGIAAALVANVIWGLSPLFYKALSHVPTLEVLCHRTLWSLVFFGFVLIAGRRLRELGGALGSPTAFVASAFAASMIGANWFLFIWSVQEGRAVEASLGYYIFPLVSVVLGVVFFRETLNSVRLVSLALVSVAVCLLTWGLGALPFVSLALALTFGAYSVAKKNAVSGPVVSVTAEVALLAPVALVWLSGVHFLGWAGQGAGAFGQNFADSLLLALCGPITATPLILYSFAARQLRLATVGLLQYVNPTLQFLVAVLVFTEPFTHWHAMAFPLIWIALAIYSFAGLRLDRSARSPASRSGTEAATDT
ncbi:MAG: EamA family transporter RarD [Rhodobacter sp.]|nr:EamA family transporter RarD [Rhodobacter sp.]MCY4169696.1 EamA family transporter RarD [Rhodobacter sp.]MCY4240659.1 EamA family transporter RarD [Rhodobacter sp.]